MTTESRAPEASSGRAVLVATILASSMAFIDGSALNVALPALQTDLGLNGSQLLWVTNAYLLVLSALILLGGSLGDRYGRKRVFGIGICIFTLASMACGFAQDANFLILMRAVQGIGGALLVPGSQPSDHLGVFPGRRTRQGDWHMVNLQHADDDWRPDSRRLAGGSRAVAGGLFHQRAAGADRAVHADHARAGKPR